MRRSTGQGSRTRSLRTAGFVLALGALSLSAAPAHAAARLPCGAGLTVDTTLTEDLVCPDAGNGLVVRGDGVVLDLAGHRIVGGGSSGVLVQGRDVVVRGGTVTAFGEGISVWGGASATVERVTLLRNITGIDSDGEAVLRDSEVRANSRGVLAEGDGVVSVEGSDLARNPTAVSAYDGGDVRITDSTVRSNQRALDCDAGTLHVRRSVVLDSGTAVRVNGCAGSSVAGSLFVHNDVQVVDPALATRQIAFSCTRFLDGRSAPAAVPCP
ncbi:right-handed parallel beta-helix repeat-containing protein [Kineococcus sp. NBC_00420]|uniref:right-handed parallel beta-helix repeat-containing protein n=1 Tax=Kineococcus sp. NBC_00420 TaxID=2903564 RepID=UPI002E235347